MRLQITRSANAECFYIVESIRRDGRNTSRVVEKLGNLEQVRQRAGGQDPYEWAKNYAKQLTESEKEQSRTVIHEFSQSTRIPSGETRKFNGGYLFLQRIYHELKLPEICRAIKRRHDYEYDLNAILSRLLYCRIIKPASKAGTYEFSQTLLEPSGFDLHQIYRALDVLAEEGDYIQEKLYMNSKTLLDRNTEVLYYDCTNYFFEIEEEKGIRKFGACKEGRALPIVGMGLLMDGNGIPLAFCIDDGKTNEQTTLKPLEQQILSDFGLSRFIVCTDAGLSSVNNKYFNSRRERNFITATSVKKLPEERKTRLLQSAGWNLVGDDKKEYDLSEIDADDKARAMYYDQTFYKEEWFIDQVEIYDAELGKKVKRDLPQRLIITFSFKYRDYLRTIRNRRLERAAKLIEQGRTAIKRKGKNDVREYIQEISYTKSGEVAENHVYGLDQDAIDRDAAYDGFYAVYTSLDAKEYPVSRINSINHGRWEIEECFRIMKSEFRARPVYLQKDNRIKAHFLTCYIALIMLRITEYKLDHRFTYTEIIDCLSDMEFVKLADSGYIPAYTRSDLTDALHDAFGFHTDYEILSRAAMKNIFSLTKNTHIL